MLEQLLIENFAIIDQVDLTFDDHLTVLTGETGAGKSIIIDALALLTGGRASSEMIRQGADKAVLQAVFSLPSARADQAGARAAFEAAGIPVDEDQVVLYRSVNQKGRSVIRVNGVIVTLKTLATLGRYLVEIQGQHDTSLLLQADSHLQLLDDYARQSLATALTNYQGLFTRYRDLTQQINQLEKNQQSLNQQVDLLTFQRDELAAAALQEGEEETLTEQRRKLVNYKKIADGLEQADQALSPGLDGGAVDLLAAANQSLAKVTDYDQDYENLANTVAEAYYAANDAARQLSEAMGALSYDEQALLAIDDRLQLLHSLKRKYGQTVSEILAFQDKVNRDLASLDGGAFDLDQLQAEKDGLRTKLVAAADQLTAARQQAAQRLETAVNQELADLLMPQARFEVVIEAVTGFLPTGQDKVHFFVQTNQGEGVKPLEKVVSGGEAARLMLALKTVFITQQGIGTVVFDEIDTGVSGRVGSAIADKMKTIGARTQVLAITHLPQVAAAADHHFLIEKSVQGERTVTAVTDLPEAERDQAIAMMLSGSSVTAAALANAHDLREKAK
ncbi:DNA repair protein RecN [Leuconostocaceae bacterium ESL0958]|nr:DNA repair protein RecN [Leuconostocaceae bacterium ESL0958]